MLRALAISLLLPLAAFAQDDPDPEALAQIRAELTALAGEIEALRGLLLAEAPAAGAAQGTGPALLRLGQLEESLQRLTGEVEALRFRIAAIVEDGTNRIGDLEFRLVELEGGDVAALGETSILGGAGAADATMTSPLEPATPGGAPAMAVGEEDDFQAAMTAFRDGDLEAAVTRYDAFLDTYPGGPLSVQAFFHRGEALAGLDRHKDAARSYLDAFTADPAGDLGAQALMRVGTSLNALGQAAQACSTLREVINRYPDSAAAGEAQGHIASYGCP